jgi:hypothetical protein
MIDKYNNNNIRVFKEFKVSKESSYFVISSKDRLHRVGSYKQAKQVVFGCRNAFPVLNSCRILRRTDTTNTNIDDKDIDNDKEFDIERKMKITSNPTPTDGTPMLGSTNPTAVSNLPSRTLQENNNGSTLSTTAEEDDDGTVQTSNSNPTKQQGWISYNIKLLLTNKHDTSDSALQHAMLTILETIDREMGADVKMFDGVQQQVTDFQVQPPSTFRAKFPVSLSRAHQKYNRSATAWALFMVQTRQTLKDIRTHPMISQVLSSPSTISGH